jgi:hypothetical protein
MSRTKTQNRNPDRRIFSSPVALAYARVINRRRGIAAARPYKAYLSLAEQLEAGG